MKISNLRTQKALGRLAKKLQLCMNKKISKNKKIAVIGFAPNLVVSETKIV